MSIKRFIWIPLVAFIVSIGLFVNFGSSSVVLAGKNHALSRSSLELTRLNGELQHCINGVDELVLRVQTMERLISNAQINREFKARSSCLNPTLDNMDRLLVEYLDQGGEQGKMHIADLKHQTESWLLEARRILGIQASSWILAPHAFKAMSDGIGHLLVQLENEIAQAPVIIARTNTQQVQSMRRTMIGSLLIFSAIMAGVIVVTRRFVADVEKIADSMKALCAGDLAVDVSLSERRGELSRLAAGVMTFRDALVRLTNAEARHAHLANHDPLTEIYNRRYLMEFGDELTKQGSIKTVVLLKIDLDYFKQVNDTYGHAAGDIFLIDTVKAMQSQLRSGDVLARLGGDEFTVILTGSDVLEVWPDLVDGLMMKLGEPVMLQGQPVDRSACIGISTSPNDGVTIEELLASADVALYEGKNRGRGCSVRVDSDMLAASQSRNELSRAIELGVENAEFFAWFQPKIAAMTGRVVGFEALARWKHSERGLLTPFHFIVEAESSDLVIRIGEQVLEDTLRALKHLKMIGRQSNISINASARELSLPCYANKFIAALQQHQIDSGSVSIEILETVALESSNEHVSVNLQRLKDFGISIWIDDFGTGFSTVSVLRHPGIHGIKIDRSFVCSEQSEDGDKVLLESMVRMAKAMGKACLLEGVETKEELDYTRKIGCDTVQGYYYAQPMPFDMILPWLATYETQESARKAA